MLFDTHTHIYLPEFDDDREAVVQRAVEAGVSRMMLPNVDVMTIDALQAVLEAYPHLCIGAMGLHPTSVDDDYSSSLDIIEARLDSSPYHAVGEIGIDLYWDKTFLKEQIDAFEMQVRWAAERNMPIIIHCREAFAPIVDVLRRLSYLTPRGVFHSFGGDADDLAVIADLGDFYIGVNGIVTFKNSSLRDMAMTIPLDRLVIETDAPYLAPVPHRGRRNEPAYVRHTAEFMALCRDMSVAELEQTTYDNACRLFGL